jgi:glycosyltransferase involved in cell wall biosynthesis
MIGPDKGDGSLQKVLSLIADYGLKDNITITGPIQNSEVPTRLQDYDLFINTTHLESFGVAVMEAAAVGLPIVTTSVGELPLLWTHGHDALMVPDGDAEAMAKAIAEIISTPTLAENLSRNARVRAEEFNWGSILPTWEKLFKSALK